MRNFSRSNLGASRGPLELREVSIHGTGLDVNMTASRSTEGANIPDSYGRKHMGISAALHWNEELRVGARVFWHLLGLLRTSDSDCGEGFWQKFWPSGPDKWKCRDDPPAPELSGAALDLS